MGEHQQTLLNSHIAEAGGRSEKEPDDGALGLQSTSYESRWLQESKDAVLGLKVGEEIPPEEVARDGIPEAHLEEALEQNLAEDVPEMSRLSITEKAGSASTVKGRRRRGRRLLELAKPKANRQGCWDRRGCGCKGCAWISPHMMTLQFCLYWPSVYWTERFLEDTTLTVTVPVVSRRVEALARPRRFYLDYYSTDRTSPIWPIPRSTLEYEASNRLKELAAPKVRNNIWSINLSEVSRVSRAAQMAVPSPRILRLAKPRVPATLMEEWDPVPKPKPHVSDYNRLLQLAMPKAQSEKCVPDRSPRWEVLDITKNAVASPRIISLAKPKVRKGLNEGYNPYYISPASLMAQASPRIYELATPKSITKKV